VTDIFKGIAHGFVETKGIPCEVIPRGQGLEINSGSGEIQNVLLPYVGISPGLMGMDDAYICFHTTHNGKSVKVLVSDKMIVTQIQAIGAPRSITDALAAMMARKSKNSFGRAAVFAVLALIVVGLGFGVWALFGYAANKAVSFIPPDWEKEIGKSAASGILQENKVCSDPELLRAMNEMGTRLMGGLGNNTFSFKMRVVDTKDVNAFALPGGYIFINSGLLEQADDSFEVAGVVAHEIQHVILRHGLHNVVRQAGSMILLSALFGDVGGIQQFLLYNAASLASMSFSRDQENAADQGGLNLMYKSGMDPAGLSRFLDKLAKEEGAVSGAMMGLISDHPASKDRVETLNDIIASTPQGVITPLNFDIKNLKINCAPVALTDPDGDI
jgi:Zn-dependent protease with chaperone function